MSSATKSKSLSPRQVDALVERRLLELAAASRLRERVDEDAAHHLRGHAEEVRAVLPAHLRLVDEPEVRLVDEGRGLEGVADALAPQVAGGEPPQLRVDERQQVFEGRALAFGEAQEQPCYFMLRRRGHGGTFGIKCDAYRR